jgi:CrcB protein
VPRRLPSVTSAILAVVFLGGVVGGLARYGLTEAWPTSGAGFPWSTFAVNTAGAFALPLLVILVADVLAPRRLLRPLLGTGFLGAFTTFSSVTTSTDRLIAHGHVATAVLYLVGSLLAAAVAVLVGAAAGRAIAPATGRTQHETPEARP